MKIAFVWFWDKASQIIPNWRDGLRSAIELISKEHKVDWYLDKKLPTEKYDFYLVWDDSNTQVTGLLPEGKKGICLTTDPTNIENLKNFDVIFCESEPVYNQVRSHGLRAIKAFGTDTDFFKPTDVKKDIEYYYPATFSPWKRQSKIAHFEKPILFVGTIQPDGVGEYEAVVKEGRHKVEIGYFKAEIIRDYYNRSKKVIIPAVHGSERTVLEAMACGIKPILTAAELTFIGTVYENLKAYSYIEELEASGLTPREFVVKNYSHKVYAQNLLKGMKE
jgi:glycosyltransferase involved in cell wall biosynthesis